MLSDASVSYGSSATTYGKIYSSGSINHQGTAYADLYADNGGSVTGNPTLLTPPGGVQAKIYTIYTNPSIRKPIKIAVNFSNFLTSLTDIKRAASQPGGGVYLLGAPAGGAWKLVFNSDGTFTSQSCSRATGIPGGYDVAQTAPTCGAAVSHPVPANGAIYTEETAIVSGTVNGRVTVASNDDIVIGGSTSYVQTGDDVLGLVAKNDMVVAYYVPTDLAWRAATLAQSGRWTDWCGAPGGGGCNSHGTMDFTGSTATANGGSMSMFNTRNYNYDQSLLYLQPPWFPTVEDAYTVILSRELKP
jgi:hypothetical protein